MNTQTNTRTRRAAKPRTTVTYQGRTATQWKSGLHMFVGSVVNVTAVEGINFVGTLVFADQYGLTLDETGFANETDYIYIPLNQVSFIAYQQ